MKTLPTKFNGITFRSRTEARWAVFMDYAGIPFEYEPEGYDLGKAGWYLPDFWLLSLEMFLEIKPAHPVPGRSSPVEALCLETKKPVFQIFGSPTPTFDFCEHDSPNSGEMWTYEEPLPELPPLDLDDMLDLPAGEKLAHPQVGYDEPYFFCCCPICKKMGVEFLGRAERINCKHGDAGGHKTYNADDPFLLNAYAAAVNAFKY